MDGRDAGTAKPVGAGGEAQSDLVHWTLDREPERHELVALFQQAPGFLCFLRGPDFVFELANPAYFQLVGHREILGKPALEALPELAGQGLVELLERVVATGEPFVGRAMPLQIQKTPGAPLSQVFVDFVYQPIRSRDGQVTGILALGHDVTEAKVQESRRQEAEEALRLSESRLRGLFESIDEGFCLVQILLDSNGKPCDYRFLEVNRTFEEQTGLELAVGKTARELVPDLDESWFRLYGDVALTGKPARFENHAPAMGRWFDVYANRFGEPSRREVALVFKDITQRKQVEAEREELLRRESAARAEAEQANRLKDEFLATVSHELRTPLSAILGWTQLLRRGSLPPEKRERALETVERSARAQAQLVEDLLDVGRILSGKLRLEVAPVELYDVVNQAVETVRPAAQAKGVQLQAVLDADARVMGDATRLQQVVWNLLSNAVKFTPPEGRVQVVLERVGAFVEVAVQDTGQGIAPAFLPYVFDRFRQAEGGATTRVFGGLGLGLSIVKHLSEAHGGTVSVFSEGMQKGSRFVIQLPLATKALAPLGHPVAEVKDGRASLGMDCPPELHGLRVLVVEDEPDTREFLQTLLEGCGAHVRVESSSEAALRAIQTEQPELILSDIGMPSEDGYALLRKVRTLEDGAAAIPAIALTAFARPEDQARARSAGFQTHLSKPVEPLALLSAVASLSAKRR